MDILFSNERSGHPALYIAQQEAPGWCGLWYPPNGIDKTTLSLSESWQEKRVFYLFARKAPDHIETFAQQLLNRYRERLPGGKAHFVWLHDTADISQKTAPCVVVQPQQSATVIDSGLNFKIGKSVTFTLGPWCFVEFDEAYQHFEFRSHERVFGILGFTSDELARRAINKQSMDNLLIKRGLLARVNDDAAYLPFDGGSRGCLRFGVALGGENSLLDYRPPVTVYYPGADPRQVSSQVFPIIDTAYDEKKVFQASIDPLQVTYDRNADSRTFFMFPPGTRLPTYFRTDGGHPVYLEPAALYLSDATGRPYDVPESDGGRLVVVEQPSGTHELALQGGFHISLDEQHQPETGVIHLLCGLAGEETVACMPKTADYSGDMVYFEPGRSAYAPNFPIPPDVFSFKDGDLLRGDFVTTWLTVKPGEGRPSGRLAYLSQPRGATLYRQSDAPKFLDFYRPASADLIQTPVAFPMVPYAGIEADGEAASRIADLEQHIIAPSRKHAVEQVVLPYENAQRDAGTLYEGATRTPATTPQGLYIEVNDITGAWTTMILSPSGGTSDLQFRNLTPRLKNAFQANQQFLVCSLDVGKQDEPVKPGVLGDFDNQVSIGDWGFTLNVPGKSVYPNYTNVLIFKFCAGTVLDRVQNPGLWTSAENFNATRSNGLMALASWLADTIQAGVDNFEQRGDTNYAHFARIVQDPDWNGILALQTDIKLQEMPADLKGLLGAMDLPRFKAHHVGITVNRIAADADGALSRPASSSLFGLIDYVDRDFAPFKGDIGAYKSSATAVRDVDYRFKVLSLKVLFENSRIKNFSSFTELTINRLFGDVVTRDNLLILAGSYENHNGTPVYNFTCQDNNCLVVDNPTLTRVTVQKATFSTVQDGANERINARFNLSGYMNFAGTDEETDKLDLLSFGSDTPEQAGLAYANLGIGMSFILDAPADKTFVFDASQIGFDLQNSSVRPGSLYAHFPLTFSGFACGDGDNLPANQGFLKVDIPGGGSVAGEWYGLVFDLKLGTLGVLAGEGAFTARLLAAWEAGTGTVAAGIKLPGVNPTSKFLSIQGFLKLDIAEIKLLKGQKQNGKNGVDNSAYLMMFNDIALHFLGAKLPPDAEIDFYLFGDPEASAGVTDLGWYAAYQKKS